MINDKETRANAAKGKKNAEDLTELSAQLQRLEKCVTTDSKKLDAIEEKLARVIEILSEFITSEGAREKLKSLASADARKELEKL